MKQTRYLSIFLTVLLVGALAYLLMDLTHQQKRQEAFSYQIESAAYSLSILPPSNPDLERELAEAELANTAALQAVSVDSINSTAVINMLMSLAETCNLTITPVTTESWNKRQVNGTSYSVLPIEFKARGILSDLVEFVRIIDDSEQYPYLIISDLDLFAGNVNENSGTGLTAPVEANLSVAIIVRYPQPREEIN